MFLSSQLEGSLLPIWLQDGVGRDESPASSWHKAGTEGRSGK